MTLQEHDQTAAIFLVKSFVEIFLNYALINDDDDDDDDNFLNRHL